MATLDLSPVELERAAEQVRQERETFNQRKDHGERWFRLRLAMGYSSIVLLGGVMGISGYVLLSPAAYSGGVLATAGGALFVDVLGLLAGVWKISLSPELAGTLSPVTKSVLSSSVGAQDDPTGDA